MFKIGIVSEGYEEGLKTAVIFNEGDCNSMEKLLGKKIMALLSVHIASMSDKCLEELGIRKSYGNAEVCFDKRAENKTGGKKHG